MSTPSPMSNSSNVIYAQLAITIVSSIVLVVIQLYLVNRVERAKLSVERLAAINEKSEVSVKPQIMAGTDVVINIVNIRPSAHRGIAG